MVATYQYDAYGNLLKETGNVENPYRYAGYRYDKETGLYYLQSRYYNPETGRFLTRDTFEGFEKEPLSLNKYAYTENNPVMKIDPNGYYSVTRWGRWGFKLWLNYWEAQKASYYWGMMAIIYSAVAGLVAYVPGFGFLLSASFLVGAVYAAIWHLKISFRNSYRNKGVVIYFLGKTYRKRGRSVRMLGMPVRVTSRK